MEVMLNSFYYDPPLCCAYTTKSAILISDKPYSAIGNGFTKPQSP